MAHHTQLSTALAVEEAYCFLFLKNKNTIVYHTQLSTALVVEGARAKEARAPMPWSNVLLPV
jgi:hypothetical protein